MMDIQEQTFNEALLSDLLTNKGENSWIEFKTSFSDEDYIGERLAGLSNGANLSNKHSGYMVFGIEDETLKIVGTTFNPQTQKVGNEELEHWLVKMLSPKIGLKIISFKKDKHDIVIFQIAAAIDRPTGFKNNGFVRVGSINRNLRDFPDLEKKIWQNHNKRNFEKQIAVRKIPIDEVLDLIDYPNFFLITKQPLPDNKDAIIEKMLDHKIIIKNEGLFDVSNLGAILFARDLRKFDSVKRKAPRVIFYEGVDKTKAISEQEGIRGYAISFPSLIRYINEKLPSNEEIEDTFRIETKLYPRIAIRELVANALIHQDFFENGSGPMIEIYSDRIEIINPGKPLVDTDRFIDHSPQSRNEDLAAFMRRINICEERGSGIDKVISSVETFQLPAPKFETDGHSTKATLFSYKKIKDMDKEDKIRACYQHCALKYVSNNFMNNSSLRIRFKVSKKNYSIISRIISEAQKLNLIKPKDSTMTSKKYITYVPFWA